MELTPVRALFNNTVMADLRGQWGTLLNDEGMTLQDYSTAHLDHASGIAEENPPSTSNATFALKDGRGQYHALFHVNRAQIKGHAGWTLRVHWVLPSPKYDIHDVTSKELAEFAAGVFYGAYNIHKEGQFASDRLKIHLSNVGDRRFVMAMAYGLQHQQPEILVDMAGNWLLIEG